MTHSKLTWHFQSLPAWAGRIVNAPWVKIMDPPIVDPFPGRRTIGRVYIPDAEANAMIKRGAAGADEYFERCRPAYDRSPWVWCWEGPNEPPVATTEQRAALVAFTRRWVERMHARAPRLRTVALCLSVGWPDIGQAGELAGALEATDYWALHEYSAPSMQTEYDPTTGEGWLTLRYRLMVRELRAAGARIPPLLITETGIDGGVYVTGRPGTGWRSYASREQFLAQLVWYDSELRRDDYVVAATIFTSGPNADWLDFDVDEALSESLAAYIASQVGPEPAPPAPDPQPSRQPLPEDEPSMDPIEQARKLTWWSEEATRALERGDVARARAIVASLASLGYRHLEALASTRRAPNAFSQHDPRWAADYLGSSSRTVGQAGCLITAVASGLADLGIPMDPGWLNAWLASNHGYLSGNLYVWRAIEALGVQLDDLIDCRLAPAPVDRIRQALQWLPRNDAPAFVVAQVDARPGGPIDEHWVRILDVTDDGRDAWIIDPWQDPGREVSLLSLHYMAPGWDLARAVMAVGIYRRRV